MSEFEAYWQRLCQQNPNLTLGDQTRMRLTIASFRVQVERAFEAGAASVEAGPSEVERMKDFFDTMFGGRS